MSGLASLVMQPSILSDAPERGGFSEDLPMLGFRKGPHSVRTEYRPSGSLPAAQHLLQVTASVLATGENPVLQLGSNEDDPEVRSRFISKKMAGAWRSATNQEIDQNLSSFIAEISGLLLDSDIEEQPTKFAVSNIIKVVPRSYFLLSRRHEAEYRLIPTPSISTDDTGGIRVRWQTRYGITRELRVNIGSTSGRRTYIYFESGMAHGTEDVTATNLSERLYWLVHG